ncbi:hypothetical protein E5288_WYG006756 [Bos mutus]|uniref:Lipocalin/cytosolic fatty-acid binding domain-containing protein n=1 Tax=Bos mutus TaxID=72004 RepID=A0A6B0RKI6_9CETA|nr:hypothetical protein [Bos mutus]
MGHSRQNGDLAPLSGGRLAEDTHSTPEKIWLGPRTGSLWVYDWTLLPPGSGSRTPEGVSSGSGGKELGVQRDSARQAGPSFSPSSPLSSLQLKVTLGKEYDPGHPQQEPQHQGFPAGSRGEWGLYKKGSGGDDGENKFRILQVNYSQHIIFYLENFSDSFQLLELYAREPDTSPELKNEFVEICQKYGVVKENVIDLTKVDTDLNSKEEQLIPDGLFPPGFTAQQEQPLPAPSLLCIVRFLRPGVLNAYFCHVYTCKYNMQLLPEESAEWFKLDNLRVPSLLPPPDGSHHSHLAQYVRGQEAQPAGSL